LASIPAFRQRVWRWKLQRRLRRSHPERHTVPDAAIQCIAVLYRADQPADIAAVEAFAAAHRNRGRQVQLLGFARKAPANWPAERALVTQKECSWTGIPKGAAAEAFLSHPAELLVGAWIGPSRPLQWLASVHPAAWRAGEHHPEKEAQAELQLALPEGKHTVEALLAQLDHFLPAIRLDAPSGNAQASASPSS
jgi:hypothetical protein